MAPPNARPWLAIEAATALGSVAIGERDMLLAEVVIGVQARHSEALLPAIEFSLRQADVAFDGLAGIVVGCGPGSFTGIRIAAAAAKGLVHVLGVPLRGATSLAALALGAAQEGQAVCALVDARRDEVYAGCYRFDASAGCEVLVEPRACAIGDAVEAGVSMHAVFAGDGAARHSAVIRQRGGRIAGPGVAAPRASALLRLLDMAGGTYSITDPASWEPLYLRASGAERGLKT
jgi:tRNA threonylcarbamoyladenosine biosynthesis protein TsaB